MIYTQKSLFLNESEMNNINNSLTKLFIDIGKYVSSINDTTNIYLSGSLARGEPSVQIGEHVIRLKSDIDFVFVNQSSKDNHKFKYITKELNRMFPGYQISCVVIDEKSLPFLQSFFARDLSLTFDWKICQNFSLKNHPSYEVTKENFIESVATQLACYMLHPDFTQDKSGHSFFRDTDYHWLKAILECLRLPFYQRGIIAYHDVVILNFIDEIRDAVSSDIIMSVMKARELSVPCTVDRHKIYSLVYNLLSFSYGVGTEDQLKRVIFNQEFNQYTYFQFSVVALFLFFYSKDKDWLLGFTKLVQNIRFADSTEILDLKRGVEDYFLNPQSNEMERIFVLFRKIRNKYVEILHKRNTCENTFSDLQG